MKLTCICGNSSLRSLKTNRSQLKTTNENTCENKRNYEMLLWIYYALPVHHSNGFCIELKLFHITLIKKFIGNQFCNTMLNIPWFCNCTHIASCHHNSTQHWKIREKKTNKQTQTCKRKKKIFSILELKLKRKRPRNNERKKNTKIIYNLFGRHFANQIRHFLHNTKISCICQNMLPNRWIKLLLQRFS